MRRPGMFALVVWLTSSGLLCSGASYDLQPRTVDSYCSSLVCPLALGSEVVIDSVLYTDVEELVPTKKLVIGPRGIADATFEGHAITLHPKQLGRGHITATIDDETTIDREFSVQAVATTRVVPYGVASELARDGLAVFAGTALVVIAEHRNAAGQRLLGHGIESWQVEGGVLEELAETSSSTDYALMRRVQTADQVTIAVSAGRDAPLVVEVVAPGSTSRLALLHAGVQTQDSNTIELREGEDSFAQVLAFTAADRYLVGTAGAEPLTVASSDHSVVAGHFDPEQRTISLQGIGPGTADLTVRFDGAEADFKIHIGD